MTLAIDCALEQAARNGSQATHPFFLEDKNGVRLHGSVQDFYKAEQILYLEPNNFFHTHGLDELVAGSEMLEIFQERFEKLRTEK